MFTSFMPVCACVVRFNSGFLLFDSSGTASGIDQWVSGGAVATHVRAGVKSLSQVALHRLFGIYTPPWPVG